jgi:hypothetical protein
MSEIAAFIDTVIDNFVVTRKKPKASFTQFLKSQDIDRRTINDFVDNKLSFVTDQIEELSIALDGDDEVVKEGYGNFRRPELRDFKELLNQIVDDLYAYKSAKKITRKKRRVTPEKLVKLVTLYDKELVFDDTTYKPIPATDIIGSKHVFLYNVEKRELCYYTGRSLSVRRTMVDGFDPDKSWVRTLRKPEEFLSEVISSTKFNVETIGNHLTTKPKTPTGRMTSKHILIKVIT